jgi:hypothetical protein
MHLCQADNSKAFENQLSSELFSAGKLAIVSLIILKQILLHYLCKQ